MEELHGRSRITMERSLMPRSSLFLRLFIAITLLVLAAAPSRAQFDTREPAASRFEITPFVGYQWGGSFSTNATSTIPAGELAEHSALGWGAIAGYLLTPFAAVELTYLRQDTDVDFKVPALGTRNVGGFSNNYILLGGRREFPTPGGLRPFVSAGIGVNVLDPKGGALSSDTRFAWTLGGGVRYVLPNRRLALRMDLRWVVTPVPSGDYATWCDFWGCGVAESTAFVSQGHVGGGVTFAF
jgi:opacity protein-like surface antigen